MKKNVLVLGGGFAGTTISKLLADEGMSITLIEKEEFHWSFTLQFIIGLVTVILNLFGKIETKTKQV